MSEYQKVWEDLKLLWIYIMSIKIWARVKIFPNKIIFVNLVRLKIYYDLDLKIKIKILTKLKNRKKRKEWMEILQKMGKGSLFQSLVQIKIKKF